mgnify:CR=1 FL=1
MMEESLVPPGYFGDSSDNIIIIPDLVSPVDLENMSAFMPHIKEWDNPRETEYNDEGVCIYDASYWWDRMCSGDILQRINPFIFEMINKYILKIGMAIEDKFGVSTYARPPVLVRWLPGNEQLPHADKQLNDGTPNPFPTYDLNSIIYWNDDFEGGQIYYPQHDIELEIKAGMGVAHIGDVNYLHGVKEIKSGIRWTTPSFYTVTGFNQYSLAAFGEE